MRHLILVRHSISAMNKEKPASEWNLSEEGRRLCDPLAKEIAAFKPSVIFSSEEVKAIETAGIIGRILNIEINIGANLHEHKRQNVPISDPLIFQKSVREFFDHPNELVFGEETAAQATRRFSMAISHVVNSLENQSLIIVSHGTVMTLFTKLKAEIDPYQFWESLDMPSYLVFSLPSYNLVEVNTTIR